MSFVVFALSCFVVLGTATAQKVTFQNVPTDITDNVYLLFMNGSTVSEYVKLKLEDGLTLPSCVGFDAQRETVFHFHGWNEDPETAEFGTVTLGTAFLQRSSSNVVFFDYSTLVKLNYADAFINATYIGSAIGQYFQQYVPTVQIVDFIHCTSFSLGSQIMSKAAQTFGAGLLPWLTAMDPADPLYNIPTVDHLTSADGKFVDVIHSDGGFFGDFRSVGTVDFFPNNGTRVQPPCRKLNASIYCNHFASLAYYSESLNSPTAFPGKKCTRSILGNPSTCSTTNEFTYIGYSVDKSETGNFYLTTAATSPYGLGTKGMDSY